MNFSDHMKKAIEINQVLDLIPKASMHTIKAIDFNEATVTVQNPQNIMAVVLNETSGARIVATVSRHYKLVQHKEAFQPIIDGLTATKTAFNFAMFQTDTKATLKVFVGEIPDNGKAIKLGFEATNSIDGRNAITYSLSSSSVTKETTIEIVGYRLACKNGMKIRVPLAKAEELKLEKTVVDKVTELLSMASRIVHIGEAKKKIEAVQYVVEAMALLKEPVALIIQKSKDKKVGQKLAKELLAEYIGKRLQERILGQFKKEEQSLWGLYNAITYIASNGGVKVPTMNGLIDKSARLLEEEVFVKAK